VIAGDALMLWSTRPLRRRVLTPEPVGVELEAAGWTALDAWRWRDEDGTALGRPLALAAVRRRARRDGAA
jgi:hypothetical protein